MSESSSEVPEPKHDPLAALREPRFVFYTASRLASSYGNAMLQAILAWHIFELTHSALSLGILGLVRFVPSLGLSMIGGAVADSYNRRNIIMVSQTTPLVCGVVFAIATINGWITQELIYGLVLFIGIASAFEAPARQAILPAIVRPENFANAVTLSSTLQSFGMVTGLVVGGVLADVAVGASYIVYSGAYVLAFITMGMMRYEQPADGPRREVSVSAIKEGLNYVFSRQEIYGSMTLDMFAVIFGGAKGILPVYAKDILHVGGLGYGMLFASLEIGAFIMAIILVMRPPIYRTGRALIYSAAMFGLLTMLFGLSRNIYLSIALFMLIGCADQISVVMRNVIIQLATPDALRGRVSSVNMVFIQASNQLGGMESGFVAAAAGPIFSVVSGGAAALAVAGAIGWRLRQLFNYTTDPRPGATQIGLAQEAEEDREKEAAAIPGIGGG
jgi:MFS family permease